MNTEQTIARCVAINEEVSKLNHEQAEIIEAWAQERTPHKIGDVIPHNDGAMVRGRVISIRGGLYTWGATPRLFITLRLRMLKKNGEDSEFTSAREVTPTPES